MFLFFVLFFEVHMFFLLHRGRGCAFDGTEDQAHSTVDIHSRGRVLPISEREQRWKVLQLQSPTTHFVRLDTLSESCGKLRRIPRRHHHPHARA